MDFIKALKELQAACGVDNLKMSEYGISPEEFPVMAKDARNTMGGLFFCDRVELTNERKESRVNVVQLKIAPNAEPNA